MLQGPEPEYEAVQIFRARGNTEHFYIWGSVLIFFLTLTMTELYIMGVCDVHNNNTV